MYVFADMGPCCIPDLHALFPCYSQHVELHLKPTCWIASQANCVGDQNLKIIGSPLEQHFDTPKNMCATWLASHQLSLEEGLTLSQSKCVQCCRLLRLQIGTNSTTLIALTSIKWHWSNVVGSNLVHDVGVQMAPWLCYAKLHIWPRRKYQGFSVDEASVAVVSSRVSRPEQRESNSINDGPRAHNCWSKELGTRNADASADAPDAPGPDFTEFKIVSKWKGNLNKIAHHRTTSKAVAARCSKKRLYPESQP